jgi:hypothetical protein
MINLANDLQAFSKNKSKKQYRKILFTKKSQDELIIMQNFVGVCLIYDFKRSGAFTDISK